MDLTTIIIVVVAALIGAVITYFLFPKTVKNVKPLENETEIKAVSVEDVSLRDEYEKKLHDAEDKAEEIKNKYENLLAESRSKIEDLDKQIKECLNGNIDESVKEKLLEVDKLNKKIKKLKEDLEDNKKDLQSCKEKLNKKADEYAELDDKLRNERKQSKQLQTDLDNLKTELENKRKDLNLKMQSLSFVQEVLSASVGNDTETKLLYERVDNVCNYVKEELRDCIKFSFNRIDNENLFKEDLQKWAIVKKKHWIAGKTAIAFVGEFSAGKTSIVNRILSQDDPNVPLLPVGSEATTAIPTYIAGGVFTSYNFVTPTNTKKKLEEDTFKKVNKDVLGQVKGISSLIKYFVMTYDNSNLRDLSVLDTPGFSSNDQEDAERTIEVINECDALFWVFDVNAGTVNSSSIKLIKEHLKKPLYIVINKVDTKAETEVNLVEQLIRKTLRDEGVSVNGFIRFSAKSPLSDIMDPIKSIKHDETQMSYLANLTNYLNKLSEELNTTLKVANQKQMECFNKCDSLMDDYERVIRNMRNDCDDAKRIPHEEEHWFRDNNYEMSKSEYSQLTQKLNKISTINVRQLLDSYNQQIEMSRLSHEAYSMYRDLNDKWRNFNVCVKQVNKLIKDL
ncbi:dynamin family protein [Bacteroides caecigallinarum]|uniref:dynamin family protein n=1 Tax=Bacteroides caecigallinarum TaxID=1411144 RepID=UPI00195EA88F|nr:dynamin family protein [Bacteroides caecigallinarum]MBM6863583.1 dynamin family protein [Bacteroides caecigallinarum]MBU3807390.1 dynamin family protein [Candidatus Phocaeicola faecipullorum]